MVPRQRPCDAEPAHLTSTAGIALLRAWSLSALQCAAASAAASSTSGAGLPPEPPAASNSRPSSRAVASGSPARASSALSEVQTLPAAGPVQASEATAPALPQHGGFPAFFVEAGAAYHVLSNPDDDALAALQQSAASSSAAPSQLASQPLPVLEGQLAALLGPARFSQPPAALQGRCGGVSTAPEAQTAAAAEVPVSSSAEGGSSRMVGDMAGAGADGDDGAGLLIELKQVRHGCGCWRSYPHAIVFVHEHLCMSMRNRSTSIAWLVHHRRCWQHSSSVPTRLQ